MAKKQAEAPRAPASEPVEEAPEQGFNAYAAVIEGDGDPRAPRLTEAWQAIKAVLADGQTHPLDHLTAAAPDLADGTLRSLLQHAIEAGKVSSIVDGRAERRAGRGRPARKYRQPH